MGYGKQISNRIKSARAVIAAGRDHGPRIGATVDEAVGLVAGTTATTMARIAATLEARTEALDRAELALQRELGDDGALIAERDAGVAAVRAALGEARALVLGFVGEEARRPFGLEAGIPAAPTQLADYARNAADALTSSDLTFSVINGGIEVSTAMIGARVATAEKTLRSALDGLASESRENQAALRARDAAVAAWTLAYRGGATTLAGLLLFAGEIDMAARVRPTERRARGDEPGPRLDEDTLLDDGSTEATGEAQGHANA